MSEKPEVLLSIAKKIQPTPNFIAVVGGTKDGRKRVANMLAEEYKRLAKDAISVSVDGGGLEGAVIQTHEFAPTNIESKVIIFMTHDEKGQETFSAFFPTQQQSAPSNPIYIRTSLFPPGLIGTLILPFALVTFLFASMAVVKVADRYVLLQEAQAGYPAAKAKLEHLQAKSGELMEQVRSQ